MSVLPAKINAIIVDDEQPALENLYHLLQLYCPHIEVVDMAGQFASAIQKINKLRPDVVFLDVNIHDKNGFEIPGQLNYVPFFVFVTAHEKYLLRALRISAVDYLLKPIDVNQLEATEAKLLHLVSIKNQIQEVYHHSVNNLAGMIKIPNKIKTITLPIVNGYTLVEVDHIEYIRGSDNYSTFFLNNGKEIVVARTLKEYDELLDKQNFMRVHKSYLVNLAFANTFNKKELNELVLHNGISIPVSRRKSVDLQDWFRHDGMPKSNSY